MTETGGGEAGGNGLAAGNRSLVGDEAPTDGVAVSASTAAAAVAAMDGR